MSGIWLELILDLRRAIKERRPYRDVGCLGISDTITGLFDLTPETPDHKPDVCCQEIEKKGETSLVQPVLRGLNL